MHVYFHYLNFVRYLLNFTVCSTARSSYISSCVHKANYISLIVRVILNMRRDGERCMHMYNGGIRKLRETGLISLHTSFIFKIEPRFKLNFLLYFTSKLSTSSRMWDWDESIVLPVLLHDYARNGNWCHAVQSSGKCMKLWILLLEISPIIICTRYLHPAVPLALLTYLRGKSHDLHTLL